VEKDEVFTTLHDALNRLNDYYRQLIDLRYLQKLSVREIALIMEVSKSKVARDIHTALERLRRYMSQ